MALLVLPASTAAQNTAASGVIAGSVTTDQDEVRAFRVKARDTVHRISYTVYTVAGRYQIFNLPPSTYDMLVIEEGFESPVETVEVTSGQTTTVNLTLTATALVAAQGAGARGATAQRNYAGDAEGSLWFTLRNQAGPGIAAFKPNGNVPVGSAAAQ